MAVLPIVVGADPRTRAAIRHAFRKGHTTNPQVDALVREWRHRWSLRRWLLPIAVGFNLIAIVFIGDPGARFVLGLSALFMLAAIWRAERSHRQLSRYRGLVRPDPARR